MNYLDLLTDDLHIKILNDICDYIDKEIEKIDNKLEIYKPLSIIKEYINEFNEYGKEEISIYQYVKYNNIYIHNFYETENLFNRRYIDDINVVLLNIDGENGNIYTSRILHYPNKLMLLIEYYKLTRFKNLNYDVDYDFVINKITKSSYKSKIDITYYEFGKKSLPVCISIDGDYDYYDYR